MRDIDGQTIDKDMDLCTEFPLEISMRLVAFRNRPVAWVFVEKRSDRVEWSTLDFGLRERV